VDPSLLAAANDALRQSILNVTKVLMAVRDGMDRFAEIAGKLTLDTGSLIASEVPLAGIMDYRKTISDIDEDLEKFASGATTKNFDQILQLVNKRYETELAFLREVNDAVKSIRESIADQKFGVELDFASPADKVKLIQSRLDDVLSALRLSTDPKEITDLTQQAQGLVRDLLGQKDALTNDFGLTGDAIKQTALFLLNQIQETAESRLASIAEAAREGDQNFIEFMTTAAEKVGLSLDLTSEQLNLLALRAQQASEALIRLGIQPETPPQPAFAAGGWVPGSGNRDNVNARLMPGEFVMPRNQAAQHADMLEWMRASGVQQFADGGQVRGSIPLSDRLFGNMNPQGFWDWYSNLSLAQKMAGGAQLAIMIGSLAMPQIPAGTSIATGLLGRGTGLLPTYNTNTLRDLINPYSDRNALGIGWDAIKDIFGFGSDRLAGMSPTAAPNLAYQPALDSGFIPNPADFPLGLPPSLIPDLLSDSPASSGTFPRFNSGGMQPFDQSGYPLTSGGNTYGLPAYSGITNPYAFNIPYSSSPLTFAQLGFGTNQYYEGALTDRALSSGSIFGSTFSAAYTATNPYQNLQNYYSSPWMGPGVTGQGYNPYQFYPGKTTLYGGQVYRTGTTSYSPYSGSLSQARYSLFAEGGLVPGQGTGDVVPALLTPGEFVVPAEVARANQQLLESLSNTGLGVASGATSSGARRGLTTAASQALSTLARAVASGLMRAGHGAESLLDDAAPQVVQAFAYAGVIALRTLIEEVIKIVSFGPALAQILRGSPTSTTGTSGFAEGGFIGGPIGIDNIPLMASAGEFIVPRYAAMANATALETLRSTGTLPGGQGPIVFNLHFEITGSADPEEVARAVEDRIESSARTGRLGVVIAERLKRRV
jgi:hypothetical protein